MTSAPGSSRPSVLDQLRFSSSPDAAFLHTVDILSRWHPCAHSPCLDELQTLGITLDEDTKNGLARYAEARSALGWSAEIDLLVWAEAGFPDSLRFKEIRTSLQPLLAHTELCRLVAERQRLVHHEVPRLRIVLDTFEPRVLEIERLVNLWDWKGRKGWADYPIFLFFAFHSSSLKGGANGEGVYAEVACGQDEAHLRRTAATLVHELLHKLLSPRDVIRDFLSDSPSSHHKSALAALSLEDPHGMKKDELAVLDETLIYSLSPGHLLSLDPHAECQRHWRNGHRTFARIWDFAALTKEIVERLLAGRMSREAFLEKYVETFSLRGHFSVWRGPLDVGPS